MEKAKMFLFARWIATYYADFHEDENGNPETSPDFDPSTAICVLNTSPGDWYAEQLKHFNEIVWENYLENGSAQDAEKFLKEWKTKRIEL